MNFQIQFTPGAEEDIECFTAREQRIIIDGIRRYLSGDANIQTKRKKQLKPNELAPWELRIGNHRVFYDVEVQEVAVKIIAVGYKDWTLDKMNGFWGRKRENGKTGQRKELDTVSFSTMADLLNNSGL